MNSQPTFTEILSRWPSRRAIAEDTGQEIVTVHRWFQRGRVPAKHFAALLAGASQRNVALNWAELLAAANAASEQYGHHGKGFQHADGQGASSTAAR